MTSARAHRRSVPPSQLIGAICSIKSTYFSAGRTCVYIAERKQREFRVFAELKGTTMVQTTNRLFDELAKVMTDAAGAAQGARREVEALVRSQADRVMADMDVVRREEFEAVKEMAEKARLENEALAERIAKLEARLGASE